MKTFIFLRHAEAFSSGWLSPWGIDQAQKRALSFCELPKIGLIFVSCAKRTHETAEIIKKTLDLDAPIIELQAMTDLFEKSCTSDLVSVLAKYSSPPLKDQLEKKTPLESLEEVHEKIMDHVNQSQKDIVLIIGHAQILNILGLRFNADAISLQHKHFGCCEGFIVKTSVNKTLLEFLKSL